VPPLAAGAQDFVGKSEVNAPVLGRAVHYAVDRAGAERALRQAQGWATCVLDALEAPTCAVDAEGTVTASNEAFDRLVDVVPHPPTPLPYALVAEAGLRLPDADAQQVLAGLEQVLAGARPRAEHTCWVPDEGGQRWYSVRVSPLRGARGAVVTHVDVTALQAARHEVQEAVLLDGLTGLPNRLLLGQQLEVRLAEAGREGGAVAVVVVSLDRFSAVNDAVGTAGGDVVLTEVAVRLGDAVALGDTVARIGGDVFAVVSGVPDASAASRQVLAERLQQALSRPVPVAGTAVVVQASCGTAAGTEPSRSCSLLRAAEGAALQARATAPGSVVHGDEDLRAPATEADRVERRLRAALGAPTSDNRLEVHYQPVVELATGRPVGVEALVRWRDGERGLLAPAAFIDLAERTGLVVPLGGKVLHGACREVAALPGRPSLWVNLSARQLSARATVAAVERALVSSGLEPGRLVLEMTESAVVDDAGQALATMRDLKDLGVRIAIDDFGTGWSSFLYLKRYPLDALKVDRSFVAGLPDDADDRAIVTSILRLADDIGVDVVAEGVETEEQRRELVRLGCRLGQGYLFARPAPAGEVADVLARLGSGGLPHVDEVAPVRATAVPVPSPRRAGARVAARQPVPPAVRERVVALAAQGASLHTVAAALNSEGVLAPGGRRWHPRSVARALEADSRERAARR
jgi:diguanylate cyclase (GGDEF)-like protein